MDDLTLGGGQARGAPLSTAASQDLVRDDLSV
jgi:hypothetical protein